MPEKKSTLEPASKELHRYDLMPCFHIFVALAEQCNRDVDMGPQECGRLSMTCSELRNLCNSTKIWGSIFQRAFGKISIQRSFTLSAVREFMHAERDLNRQLQRIQKMVNEDKQISISDGFNVLTTFSTFLTCAWSYGASFESSAWNKVERSYLPLLHTLVYKMCTQKSGNFSQDLYEWFCSAADAFLELEPPPSEWKQVIQSFPRFQRVARLMDRVSMYLKRYHVHRNSLMTVDIVWRCRLKKWAIRHIGCDDKAHQCNAFLEIGACCTQASHLSFPPL